MFKTQIENKLKIIFNPVYLKINYKNNYLNNIKRNFKIIIVSDNFINQRFITRHRFVYSVLTKELNNIHSLSLCTYTITEWKKLKYTIPIFLNN
ncbi:BolA/IbaG family iron-sulfur metabolism protein [Enterobacteriaceae endosymbiont of Plateumaris consimilis]|uniref:BolA/IbaG family iron-sulfur metabolism protein n=1 Tax=Enterobacteriaceae endosymbiont of Plateumaris consimilis TaxID=2675794 RepID=UPI0014492B6E|nr:BolA/IbaG family iron-sulfur metabolism protein [Enterobacteriaceae endosymbiont of Plateumaris consimilis]QJC28630.1 BolA/IbaG family iron-sulfur metabolism protein [Enterobacteriaceae endosymbiont of Plateumaris consimilis]